MIRSHALYPAELTARATNNYATWDCVRQALLWNFTFRIQDLFLKKEKPL